MDDYQFVRHLINPTLLTNPNEVGYLATRCTCGEIVSAVYCENSLWMYDPLLFAWKAQKETEIHDRIFGLKSLFDSLGTYEPMSFKRVNSLRLLACDRLHREEFFNEVPRAAFFLNGHVVLGETALTATCHLHRSRATFRSTYSDTPTPLWDQMLENVFQVDEDKEQRKALIHEFLGAAMLGVAPTFKKALVFLGDGANGKSNVLQVLEAFFPSEAISHSNPQTWHEDYARAELVGKRLNLTSELPERELLESEAFKTIIEGGMIQARRVRERKLEFRPIAAHVFATNNLLKTADHSDGFFRRFVLINFNRKFEGSVDPSMAVIAAELPGIAFKAIQAVNLKLANYEYTIPSSSLTSLDEWKDESNPVKQFLRECCEDDATGTLPPKVLYKIWEGWCKDTGHKAGAESWLGRRIKQVKPDAMRRTSSQRFYALKLTTYGADLRLRNMPFEVLP